MAKNDPRIEEFPLEGELITDSGLHRGTLLDCVLRFENPAICKPTALARDLIGEVALENNIGTDLPLKIVAGPDKNRKSILLIPVHSTSEVGVKVNYTKGMPSFTLYALFKRLDRIISPDIRHFYPLRKTPAQVRIGPVTGWGLYINLEDYEKVPIQSLSEEEKESRRATRAKRQSAPSQE